MQTDTENVATPPTPMPVPGKSEVPPQNKPDRHMIIIITTIIIIILLLGIIFSLAWKATAKPVTTQILPEPTIEALATPIPNRPLSPIATQSAFISLDQKIASLSASVNSFATSDTSLTPPVLELSLGLEQ